MFSFYPPPFGTNDDRTLTGDDNGGVFQPLRLGQALQRVHKLLRHWFPVHVDAPATPQ